VKGKIAPKKARKRVKERTMPEKRNEAKVTKCPVQKTHPRRVQTGKMGKEPVRLSILVQRPERKDQKEKTSPSET